MRHLSNIIRLGARSCGACGATRSSLVLVIWYSLAASCRRHRHRHRYS